MRLVQMARAFDVALAALGDTLRSAQFEARLDLEAPSAAEVRLGLASRQLRLLSYLAGNPMFWKYPVADYVLRPMVDSRILTAWSPLSAEHHGEWQPLEEWDLAPSGDPLHQRHLFGTFQETTEERVAIQVVAHGFYLMADSVAEVFKSLEVDVVSELEACEDALTAAVATARREAEAASTTGESPPGQDRR